jgi:hypothetical protein
VLGDNVMVAGTVYNSDPLMITSPITITGNFDETQTTTGDLELLLSSTTSPTAYQLTVTGTTSLADALGIDLAAGFSLAAGDSFDLLTTYPWARSMAVSIACRWTAPAARRTQAMFGAAAAFISASTS